MAILDDSLRSRKWRPRREPGQQKALVFTQFGEVTALLAAFLGSVFGRPGLVLHGETEAKKPLRGRRSTAAKGAEAGRRAR